MSFGTHSRTRLLSRCILPLFSPRSFAKQKNKKGTDDQDKKDKHDGSLGKFDWEPEPSAGDVE